MFLVYATVYSNILPILRKKISRAILVSLKPCTGAHVRTFTCNRGFLHYSVEIQYCELVE